MSEEPAVVGTEPQEVLDSSVPHKDPPVVLEGEDPGEESDTYDEFDAEVYHRVLCDQEHERC